MKYIVTIAEFSTGIVLHTDGSRFLGPGEPRLLFDNEMEARTFASNHFNDNLNHECVVTDEMGREIEVFRPAFTSDVKDSKPKSWWKFW